MVKHVVFFRLLDEAEGKTKLENAQIIRDGLLALREKIDVLVGLLLNFVVSRSTSPHGRADKRNRVYGA